MLSITLSFALYIYEIKDRYGSLIFKRCYVCIFSSRPNESPSSASPLSVMASVSPSLSPYSIDIGSIRAAKRRIGDFVQQTEVATCQKLNEIAGAELFFKLENRQRTGAFKIRGATNAVLKGRPYGEKVHFHKT